MSRGFYLVITQDRAYDLVRFLRFLLKFNRCSIHIEFAGDSLDAYRKKTQVGMLSPFETTVMLDTDTLVNGELDHLFHVAESGFLSMAFEDVPACWNTGVMCIPGHLKKKLSLAWHPAFEEHIKDPAHRTSGGFDQEVLNRLLRDMPGFVPVKRLPDAYNYILKWRTPEQEARDFDDVKIFHFLHDDDKMHPCDRTRFRSWQIYTSPPSLDV